MLNTVRCAILAKFMVRNVKAAWQINLIPTTTKAISVQTYKFALNREYQSVRQSRPVLRKKTLAKRDNEVSYGVIVGSYVLAPYGRQKSALWLPTTRLPNSPCRVQEQNKLSLTILGLSRLEENPAIDVNHVWRRHDISATSYFEKNIWTWDHAMFRWAGETNANRGS